MKKLIKPVLFLLILEILVIVAGLIMAGYVNIGLEFFEIIAVSAGFTLITLLTFIVFFRGQDREPSSQTMHSMVAISFKFLIELVFAFVWFFIAKKTGLSAVLLFFVLYLTFTLFSVIVILKTLKNKSL